MTDVNDKEIMKSKVLACLASVAIGDALGFPAHEMTQDEIEKRFGGRLKDFHDAFSDNPYHYGVLAGQITDDTIMTLAIARILVGSTGPKNANVIGRGLAQWARENHVWENNPMFGPTTTERLKKLIGGMNAIEVGTSGFASIMGASNGAAMRVSSAGLLYPANFEKAVKLAVEVSLPTHGTQVAIAGAAAIAAGVSEALRKGADVFSVASACIKGAQYGEKIGREVARVVPAPNVSARIEMAIMAALKSNDVFEAGRLITDYIGNGLPTSEAVPAAVGLFVAAKGDPESAVIGGANIGGDTDTIASMTGALAGALKGMNYVSFAKYQQVEKTNYLGLKALSEQIVNCQKTKEV